ncbi:MAG: hypothetical protein Q8R37_00510 [Nanoarchaeota archaeon]|nr:hypothetical protein [Nanoarchaeota archaeon]
MNEEPVSLEDVAMIFKQNSSESCLLSSILFSLALQFRDAEQRNAVLNDVMDIVNGTKRYSQLEFELDDMSVDQSDLEDWTDEVNIRAYVAGIRYEKKKEKLKNYLASGGYSIEICRPSLDHLAGAIETYPLIYLLYPNEELLGRSTPFYIQHVISTVRIEDSELVFFEPYAGEIRRRGMPLIEKMWAGIGVVKQGAAYQSE